MDMMARILQWFIGSLVFRKASGMVGSFALGLWFAARYHHQIGATLDAWGITQKEFMQALVLIMGAAFGAGSIALTAANEKQKAANGGIEPGKAP
jgi:hypothetical protein